MTADAVTAIWDRVLQPVGAELPPAVASQFLRLRLADDDRLRMGELSAKAQDGALTPDEREELEAFTHAAGFLTILHSKARVALRAAATDGGHGTPAA